MTYIQIAKFQIEMIEFDNMSVLDHTVSCHKPLSVQGGEEEEEIEVMKLFC